MRSIAFGVVALASGFAMGAHAVSCGTIAAPTACVITVGGITTYTFSGFSIGAVSASGGGNLYRAPDINIDLTPGSELSALLTFSKNNANPASGTVFFTYAGTFSGTSFTYDVTLNHAAANGTVAFASPIGVDLNGASKSNDATGVLQLTGPMVQPCIAAVGFGGNHADCAIAAGQPLPFHVGSALNLLGNSGNIIVGSITQRFDSRAGHIDIDGNGSYDALTDGLILIRYLFGLRGAGLINGAIGTGATRTTAAQIEQYIQSMIP